MLERGWSNQGHDGNKEGNEERSLSSPPHPRLIPKITSYRNWRASKLMVWKATGDHGDCIKFLVVDFHSYTKNCSLCSYERNCKKHPFGKIINVKGKWSQQVAKCQSLRNRYMYRLIFVQVMSSIYCIRPSETTSPNGGNI